MGMEPTLPVRYWVTLSESVNTCGTRDWRQVLGLRFLMSGGWRRRTTITIILLTKRKVIQRKVRASGGPPSSCTLHAHMSDWLVIQILLCKWAASGVLLIDCLVD